MKEKTRELLNEAKEICDREARSTEFMIQFMQDYANVSFEYVIEFLEDTWGSDSFQKIIE